MYLIDGTDEYFDWRLLHSCFMNVSGRNVVDGESGGLIYVFAYWRKIAALITTWSSETVAGEQGEIASIMARRNNVRYG